MHVTYKQLILARSTCTLPHFLRSDLIKDIGARFGSSTGVRFNLVQAVHVNKIIAKKSKSDWSVANESWRNAGFHVYSFLCKSYLSDAISAREPGATLYWHV